MKLKYHIENSGDESVGIESFSGEATIDVDIEMDDEDFLNALNSDMKKLLQDYFDLETRCKVYTQEEYDKLLDDYCEFEEIKKGQ